MSEFLRKFELDGSNIFNNFIKKQPMVYSHELGNYRTYFLEKLQYVSEVVLETEEIGKLLNIDFNESAQKVIKEDRSEND